MIEENAALQAAMARVVLESPVNGNIVVDELKKMDVDHKLLHAYCEKIEAQLSEMRRGARLTKI